MWELNPGGNNAPVPPSGLFRLVRGTLRLFTAESDCLMSIPGGVEICSPGGSRSVSAPLGDEICFGDAALSKLRRPSPGARPGGKSILLRHCSARSFSWSRAQLTRFWVLRFRLASLRVVAVKVTAPTGSYSSHKKVWLGAGCRVSHPLSQRSTPVRTPSLQSLSITARTNTTAAAAVVVVVVAAVEVAVAVAV